MLVKGFSFPAPKAIPDAIARCRRPIRSS